MEAEHFSHLSRERASTGQHRLNIRGGEAERGRYLGLRLTLPGSELIPQRLDDFAFGVVSHGKTVAKDFSVVNKKVLTCLRRCVTLPKQEEKQAWKNTYTSSSIA